MDAALPRRYGPVKHAIARSGRSRSKDGKSTIVDLNMLDAISDSLPIAQIKLPTAR